MFDVIALVTKDLANKTEDLFKGPFRPMKILWIPVNPKKAWLQNIDFENKYDAGFQKSLLEMPLATPGI